MKDIFLKNVSSELKILRIEKGYSQEETAKESKVAMSTISKYESGTTKMNLNKIEQILKAYDITLSIFFEKVVAKTQR